MLEVCDSENMKAAVAAEQQLTEVNDDFEEDFALMTGKSLKKTKPNDFDVDMEDDIHSNEESNASADNDDDEDDNLVENEIEEEMDFGNIESDDEIASQNHKNKRKYSDSDEEKDDDGDETDSSYGNVEDGKKQIKDEVWEDIYGRLRGKDGEVITVNSNKFIRYKILIIISFYRKIKINTFLLQFEQDWRLNLLQKTRKEMRN